MSRHTLIRVGGPFGLVAVFAVVMIATDHDLNLAYLLAATASTVAIGWLVSDLAPQVPYTSWKVTGTYVPRQGGPDIRLARMTERMGTRLHRDSVSVDLYRELSAVVDDRLRRGHGIDRRTDPEAAARVLGPTLMEYVSTPVDPNHPTHVASGRQLAELLTRIEEL